MLLEFMSDACPYAPITLVAQDCKNRLNLKKMKKSLLFIYLFISALASLQAQTKNASIDLETILTTYQKTVAPYLDKKVQEGYTSPTAAEKVLIYARRSSLEQTVLGINQEAKNAFKNDKFNIREVKEFIESKYRVQIGALPEEFYKKVSTELDKS
jgi:hypothetical protein